MYKQKEIVFISEEYINKKEAKHAVLARFEMQMHQMMDEKIPS